MSRSAPPPTGFGRRTFLSAGIGLVSAGLLTACGASVGSGGTGRPARAFDAAYSGKPVTLQFWNPFTGGDGPTMGRIVTAFNEAHDNITVEMTSLAADDLYAKVLPAVGSGKGPEVAIMHLDQLSTFALRGTILPLDDVVDGAGLDRQDFIGQVWDEGAYRGHRYGIPLDVFVLAQYTSTVALRKAGLTAPLDGSSFADQMQSLRSAGIENPFWVSGGNWQLYISLLAQFGGTLFDESGTRATFGGDAGVEALAWMREQVTTGVSPAGVGDVRVPFKNGSEALMADLTAAVPDLHDTAPDLEWQIDALPTVGDRPGSFANSHNFVLTAQSQTSRETAHAAQTFVQWASANSATWADAGNIPARNVARDTSTFRNASQSALLGDPDTLDGLAFLPQIPSSRTIAANSYQRAVSQVVLGQSAPDTAARFAATTAQQQLDELRKVYAL
ncbi:ABC transporter substrate-binding protein [Curtobacterium sp. VKM Ac-1376]|uniref:ABC transporter substrate-binding protein n=1 Tax=Curtobacterium sp. VKM Ac-1376 TaxID=123312 RepID=UPI00188A4339|nr:extracellular solute-binding protein [Curtobacterium sp. VKM Ac-1376]MBF4613609.1 extracellular solute-binding protein [Curtobacterium sp. VKM Ac-1376]